MLRFHLESAHNRMKMHADKDKTEKELQIGDFVYVKLQPLYPKFYGTKGMSQVGC